jgi:hypothetical protein
MACLCHASSPVCMWLFPRVHECVCVCVSVCLCVYTFVCLHVCVIM